MNNQVFKINQTIGKKLLIISTVFMLTIFSSVGVAEAWFEDEESSLNNQISAAFFDIFLTNNEITRSIGPGLTDEIQFDTLVMSETGSLPPKYRVETEFMQGNLEFCDAIGLRAQNADTSYNGPLLGFTSATTTILGTWDINLKLEPGASNFPQDATCDVDIVYKAWLDSSDSEAESGFVDEERLSIKLTANMVVLNEFLPNPEGQAYGFDFGNDSSDMPQGEWVELYNNSDFAYDLAGWYVWDDSGVEGHKIYVSGANTQPAATSIAPHDWLVVYMNKSVLNNSGDDVRLYNNNNELIDTYTYTGHDVCEYKPTPTDPNATSGGGSGCVSVPPNKSYARIPDGIGSWIDPIPTPGAVNSLNESKPLFGFSTNISNQTVITSNEIAGDSQTSKPTSSQPKASSITMTPKTSLGSNTKDSTLTDGGSGVSKGSSDSTDQTGTVDGGTNLAGDPNDDIKKDKTSLKIENAPAIVNKESEPAKKVVAKKVEELVTKIYAAGVEGKDKVEPSATEVVTKKEEDPTTADDAESGGKIKLKIE